MAALIKDEIEQETSWDLRRLLIAFFLFLFLIVGGYFAKTHVLDKKLAKNASGSVEGSTAVREEDIIRLPTQQNLEKTIQTIKKEIQELSPEDIVKQEPVKKILQDLENIQSSAASQVVGGTKNVLCEEVKKIFCSQ